MRRRRRWAWNLISSCVLCAYMGERSVGVVGRVMRNERKRFLRSFTLFLQACVSEFDEAKGPEVYIFQITTFPISWIPRNEKKLQSRKAWVRM